MEEEGYRDEEDWGMNDVVGIGLSLTLGAVRMTAREQLVLEAVN